MNKWFKADENKPPPPGEYFYRRWGHNWFLVEVEEDGTVWQLGMEDSVPWDYFCTEDPSGSNPVIELCKVEWPE